MPVLDLSCRDSGQKGTVPGAHILGWMLGIFAMLLFAGEIFLGAWNGIRNRFTFGGFFTRYLIMLYAMEIYDILFFDWFLLCHSGFFPHFYPELKEIVGPQQFGYNKRTHIAHFSIHSAQCGNCMGLYNSVKKGKRG